MSLKHKYEKQKKKADRYRRSLYRRARNMIRSLGLGELYFFDVYDGFRFSYRRDAPGVEVHTKDALEKLIYEDIEIRNFDTGKVYSNFEEYRKERMIIKMVGLDENR